MSTEIKNFSLPLDPPWLVDYRERALSQEANPNRKTPPVDIPQKRDCQSIEPEVVVPKCKRVFAKIFFITEPEKNLAIEDELMFPIEIEASSR